MPRLAANGDAPVPAVRGNQLVDARTGRALILRGVDTTGLQDACVEGQGFGQGPMDAAEAVSVSSWNANVVRVPLNEDCWLGINGVPAAYSGLAYQQQVMSWVGVLNRAGLVVILDLHWSAPGTAEATDQWPMPDADHAVTFWSEVASKFAADPSVIFDLFNEPYVGRSHPTAADWGCWLDGCGGPFDVCTSTRSDSGTSAGCIQVSYQSVGMQELVDAVRATGATQPLMIGGLNWAGDPCGVDDADRVGGQCAWLQFEPRDPDHQLIASFHTYNFTDCNNPTCWDTSVAPVAAVVPVVTGEVGERDCSASYIDQYTAWANQHDVSYLAWAWQPTISGASCQTNSTRLLNSWSGEPSSPAGTAYQQILLSGDH